MNPEERPPGPDWVDAQLLRGAARVVRRRAKRPGFWLDVYCKVLTKMADSIDGTE